MANIRVLVVCTANACRSPVVERLLARAFISHGLDVRVRSAGTSGGPTPVHAHTIAAASEVGIDLTDHVPRAVTPSIVDTDGADLVVTMTRQHSIRILTDVPDAFDRTFTLPEMARLAVRHGVDPLTSTLREWAGAIGTDRIAADLVTGSDDDDIDDPYGGPRRAHRAMVHRVDELVRSVMPLVAASIDPD